MKKEKKALLIALVLGDGYIRIDKRLKNPKTAELSIAHSEHQLDYLTYKRDLCHSLLGGNCPNINTYEYKAFGGIFPSVRFTKSHKYFKILQRWMYPDKYDVKFLKYLTPHALAIWFMDDGSLVPNNRYKDGTVSTCRTQLHVCVSKERAEGVCKYFLDYWGIKWTAYKERGDCYSIRCFHKEGRKFHELIHPYIIPSMSYKQRFYYDTSA